MMRISTVTFVAVLSLAAVACKGKVSEANLPPASGPGAAARPELPAVTAQDVVAVASSETTGTTFPRAKADVAPTMSGVIADIAVEEGSVVKKGDVLFRLRTTDLALGVQQAKAAVATAAVNETSAKVELDRAQRLFDKHALEQAQLDRAKAAYQAAAAMLQQAKVGVSMAQRGVADATVRSPIDGVVTMKLKNTGEMATMMPPSVVVVVEDHSVLELRVRLAENQVGALAKGDPLTADFTAIGVTRTATVERISPSVDPVTRTVEVVALLPNQDGALKAGMLATVSLGAPPPAPAPVMPEGKASAVDAAARSGHGKEAASAVDGEGPAARTP
jgi:RND family efflux transporter MFP subunit